MDSRFFDLVNDEKFISKMKDEFKGKAISEFVGLKSKMYSSIAADDEEVKKAKGVNDNIVKNIRHKEFTDVLGKRKMIRHNMKRLQSKLHIVLF